jgi:hypothetical protein
MKGKNMGKATERKLDKRTLGKIEKQLGGMVWNKERILDRMTGNFLHIANSYVEQGMLALFLKSKTNHGEFQNIIETTFVEPGVCSFRTIRKCMQIARFVLDNPKLADSSNFLSLGVSKQLMLAGASDDELEDGDELTIYGMTFDDFRARKLQEIKAEKDKWKKKATRLESTVRKGREQLAERDERIEELMDLRKLAGKSNKEIQRILDQHFNSINGALEMSIGELCNGGPGSAADLAKNQISLVNGFLKSVGTLVEETAEQWAEAIRKS